MNIPQLRALRAVIAAGSFSSAADLLGVTQSAVSHAVASLENEFQLRLVVRGRAGCSLTRAGERLLPYAVEALRAIEVFENEAAMAAVDSTSGRLLVGAIPSVYRLLASLARSFCQSHPAVDVVLLKGTDMEVEHWLSSRAIDVGTVLSLRSGLTGVPFVSDKFVAVLAAGHPLADEANVCLADLAGDPFLLSAGGCESQIRRMYQEQGIPFQSAYNVQSMSTLLAMVRANIGVSVLPELALGEQADGIVVVPLRPSTPRHLLLARRADREPSAVARAFLDASLPRLHDANQPR